MQQLPLMQSLPNNCRAGKFSVYPANCKNQREWVLISDNENLYPQQLLLSENVKEIWVFRRHIDNKAPPPKKFEIKI